MESERTVPVSSATLMRSLAYYFLTLFCWNHWTKKIGWALTQPTDFTSALPLSMAPYILKIGNDNMSFQKALHSLAKGTAPPSYMPPVFFHDACQKYITCKIMNAKIKGEHPLHIISLMDNGNNIKRLGSTPYFSIKYYFAWIESPFHIDTD